MFENSDPSNASGPSGMSSGMTMTVPSVVPLELLQKAATADQLKLVLDVLATALSQDRFMAAATAFVTELATRLGCDRVSLGVMIRGSITVRALSHSAHFSTKTNLLSAIAAAMEEAADQRHTIVVPPLPASPTLVTRAHGHMTRQFGSGSLCSVPLLHHGRVVGILTLERDADHPFDRALLELCEALAAVVGPVLDVKRRDDRWLPQKVWDSFGEQVGHLIGPRHIGLKLAALGLAGLAAFLWLATGDYRVSAKTVLEGAVQRTVVAPFQAYIEQAPVRAGDLVQAGQVLATLQDHDLKLDRLKWLAQKEQLTKEYRQAMAERDAAKVEIKAAETAQAEAQLALATDKLARTQITAPFAGVVVTGDWTQQLGAPVEEGQVLFEVAPLDDYRVVLQVDEREIAAIKAQQAGALLLTSIPNETFPFTVTKITPVSTAKEGRNFFRVEGRLTEAVPDRLRPAMEGVGKIEIDQRQLAWIWTHDVVDWVKLKLWAWLP